MGETIVSEEKIRGRKRGRQVGEATQSGGAAVQLSERRAEEPATQAQILRQATSPVHYWGARYEVKTGKTAGKIRFLWSEAKGFGRPVRSGISARKGNGAGVQTEDIGKSQSKKRREKDCPRPRYLLSYRAEAKVGVTRWESTKEGA